MALITTAEYKAAAGYTGSGYDSRIAIAIGVVERFVRAYCGRDRAAGFEEATWTEYLDGDGGETIKLREWPVSSITSVKFRESATAFGTAEASSSYYVDPSTDNRGLVFRAGGLGSWEVEARTACWPKGRRNIEVVYTGGYSTVPDDLKNACYELVSAWFNTSGRDAINTQQAALGVVNQVSKTEDERWARVRSLLSEWAPPMVGV